MSLGLVGRKVGMMRIFNEDGSSVPVTVLDCAGNRVAQIKTADGDGYCAIQVAYGKRRASRVTKAQAGHFAKAGVEAGSVARAREVIERERPEIIFLDVTLPDGSGLSLVERTGSDGPLVVVITGSRDLETAVQALRKARWTPPICSNQPWHAVSCNVLAPPPWMNTINLSRKMPRWNGALRPSTWRNRASRIPSRCCAG